MTKFPAKSTHRTQNVGKKLLMTKFKFNRKGLASMMEIVVASFIFMLAVFGIVSSISLLNPQSSDAAKRLQAAYLAKNILDELRGKMTPTSWTSASGDLTVGTHTRVVGDFTVKWIVTDVGKGLSRKINMQVTF